MNQPEADCQVKIRLPQQLRDWLKHQAIANHRTLQGEIAARIEQTKRQQPQGVQA